MNSYIVSSRPSDSFKNVNVFFGGLVACTAAMSFSEPLVEEGLAFHVKARSFEYRGALSTNSLLATTIVTDSADKIFENALASLYFTLSSQKTSFDELESALFENRFALYES